MLLLALVLAAGPAPASAADGSHAAWRRPQGQMLLQLARERVSLRQAVAIVQRATGGRVLDARARGRFYRIKVLTRAGVVRVFVVDARTGAIR